MAWCSRTIASALSRTCCNLACAVYPWVLETKGNWACASHTLPTYGEEWTQKLDGKGAAACAARPGGGALLPLMGIDPMKLGGAGCCECHAERYFC